MPNQVGGDLVHTMDVSRLSRVRTEPQTLLIIRSLPPHSVEADGPQAQMDVATSENYLAW
jgi:hypothetical protein